MLNIIKKSHYKKLNHTFIIHLYTVTQHKENWTHCTIWISSSLLQQKDQPDLFGWSICQWYKLGGSYGVSLLTLCSPKKKRHWVKWTKSRICKVVTTYYNSLGVSTNKVWNE